METIGDRIRTEREALGIDQPELARLVGVSKSAVNQWEKDRTVPKGPHWGRLLELFNVTSKWLETGKGNKHPAAQPVVTPVATPFVDVPLISWVEAGMLGEIADPYEPGDAYDWVPVPLDKSTLLALRVRGNSMNRVAPDGAVIIVDYADRELVPGKYYVIADSDNNATFKRFRPDPPRFEPHSTEEHETVFPDRGWRVIGRVVRVETFL